MENKEENESKEKLPQPLTESSGGGPPNHPKTKLGYGDNSGKDPDEVEAFVRMILKGMDVSSEFDEYLRRVARVPKLNKIQENALFENVQKSSQVEAEECIEILKAAYRWLVLDIARKYINRNVSFFELTQLGERALHLSVESFNKDRDGEFVPYASHAISKVIVRTVSKRKR